MLKTIFKQTTKVLKEKLNKVGLQEKFEKHPNYIEKAKEIWNMINEDLGISDTVENKLIVKIKKFEKVLLAKFPELTKDDVAEIKQSIIGEFNVGKDAVIKQLQDLYTKLQDENVKLKNQLSKFQSVDNKNTVITPAELTVTTPIESSETTIIDEKQENTQE